MKLYVWNNQWGGVIIVSAQSEDDARNAVKEQLTEMTPYGWVDQLPNGGQFNISAQPREIAIKRGILFFWGE